MSEMTSNHGIGKTQDPQSCMHHWLIEPPNGPSSEGVCKRCGDRRHFFNNPEATLEEQFRQQLPSQAAAADRAGAGA